MGIFELMVTTNDIRQLAHDRVSSWKIMQAADERGHAVAAPGRLVQGARRPHHVDEVVRNAKADHNVADARNEPICVIARPRSEWNEVSGPLSVVSWRPSRLIATDN